MLSDSEGKRKFFCTFHERISTCRRTFYERIPACSRTFYERNKRPPASFTPNARTTYVGRSGASHRPFIRAARRAHHCAASPRYVIAPLALVIRCAAAQGRRRGETLGHRGRAASPKSSPRTRRATAPGRASSASTAISTTRTGAGSCGCAARRRCSSTSSSACSSSPSSRRRPSSSTKAPRSRASTQPATTKCGPPGVGLRFRLRGGNL